MGTSVELRVKSGLDELLKDMDKLKAKALEVNTSFEEMGKGTADQLKRKTKDTETFLGNLGNFSRRVADQIKRDFKTLISVQSLAAGLKLSDQFKNSIEETVNLANAIRKLGPTFGIAAKDFASFQQGLTQGLGDIGLSSDVAVKALEGLSQTPVRGATAIGEYAKKSGQLASIGREQGKEGDISRSLARVLQARGTDPNNIKALNELTESVRRVTIQTGVQPSQVLGNMERLFEKMPEDFRKVISSKGLANLAAAQSVGGPGAVKFLEEFLGKSPKARLAFEAQGGKGLFNDKGLDIEKFRKFSQEIRGRINFDPRSSAETLGLSEEAAEGFVRLSESLDKVKDAQDRIQKSTGSLDESYRQSMGLGEAFKANLNRVKGNLSGFLESIIHGSTDALSGAAQSDVGSAAVTGGAALAAAVLTSGGLKGVFGGLLGTAAKGKIAEEVTGQKTVPVYVVNASEFGGMGGGLGGGSKGGMGLATAGAIAVAGGYAAREGYKMLEEKTGPIGPSAQETVDWAQSVGGDTGGAVMEGVLNALVKLNNLLGGNYAPIQRTQKVQVEMKSPMLQESPKPSRGASTGPR